MSNIDNQTGSATLWPSHAQQEVRELRKAITTQLDEPMVSSPAAPMMGELLARLEGFFRPVDVGELPRPELPEGCGEVSAGEATEILHQACHVLRAELANRAGDAQRSGALQAMVDMIENHLQMKSEILARNASDATPG